MESFSGLWLATLFQIYTLISAAPPAIPINTAHGNDSLSNSTVLTSTFLSALPPDPYQIRVFDTPTSLILHDYGSALQSIEVLDILLQGQLAVIDGLVADHGNAPILRLAFTFWAGELCMRVEPAQVGHMKWLMLSQALKGIVQFMEEFGWMAVKFAVLDDEAGPVGTGMMLYYRSRRVEVNGSSLVGAS